MSRWYLPRYVFIRNFVLSLILSVQNAFSSCLSEHGFDFFQMLRVDLLHEVELGLFKSVFAHLIRMLYTIGEDSIRLLNSR